jgi:hypothetical protein
MKIEILKDDSCDMVEVHKDGRSIFIGNYWDLPNSPEGLSKLLKDLGVSHTIKPYNYE